MKATHSYRDGKNIFVDCSECERGGNGNDKDKCTCGWQIKRSKKLGCFSGELIKGLEIKERIGNGKEKLRN